MVSLSTKTRLTGLQADQFRHRLDQQATAALRSFRVLICSYAQF
jgi:hypothetical protein